MNIEIKDRTDCVFTLTELKIIHSSLRVLGGSVNLIAESTALEEIKELENQLEKLASKIYSTILDIEGGTKTIQ